MKNSFVPLLFAILAAGSPLGDRAVFKRHPGVSRTFILRSDVQAPSSCSAGTPPLPPGPPLTNDTIPLDNSTLPDVGGDSLLNATLPDANSTIVDNSNSTALDNSNSTTIDNSNSTALDNSNSTTADNSTATDNSTDSSDATRRWLSTDLSEWQTLCSVSGGGISSNFDLDVGLGCVNWAGIDAVSALYAEADPCEQQVNADFMITWAKKFGGANANTLIAQAIGYRRYPRRVVKVLDVYPSSPYCMIEPDNVELWGIYNEQLSGVEYGVYGGPNYPLVSFGGDGTCPYGWNADVSTCTCGPSSNSPSTYGDSTDDSNATDTTDSADSASDPSDSSDGADSTDTTDSSDGADSADSTDSSDGASATDSTDSSDGADSTDTTDSSDGADSADTTDSSTDSSDGADSADSTDSSDGASTTDSADSSDSSDEASTTDPSDGASATDSADPTSATDPSDSSDGASTAGSASPSTDTAGAASSDTVTATASVSSASD